MKKENLVKFYTTYRLYIFPAAVIFSSLFLIGLVIFPQTMKLIRNQKVQGELVSKSQFLETKAQTLEGYDISDLNRKADVALAAYPSSQDFGVAFGILQQLVAQSGFRIISISLGSSIRPATSDIRSYELRVDVIGGKVDLPILLNNLESSPRLMRMVTLDVTSGNKEAVNVVLIIEVLYADVPQSFGSVDSPLPQISKDEEDVLVSLTRTGTLLQQAGAVTGPRGKVNPFE